MPLKRVMKVHRQYVALTPMQVIKALPGTRGIIARLARNLGCSYGAARNAVQGHSHQGKAWEQVRKAYDDECEQFGDDAEDAIQDALTQRLDISTAARTGLAVAKMKLRHRGYVERTEVTHEGGVNPIRMETKHTLVDIEKLGLPLEVRKQILEAMEKNDGQADRGEGGAAGDDE